MDNIPQLGTAADLEIRAARIVDPGIDLKTKHTVACELREMIDTVRDADSARVLPQMIPVLLEILRSGGASFHKDTLEFQFRRVLLEVLHRVPYSDVIRPQALPLLSGMLHILRHDNEENGVTSCKIIIDLLRSFRALTEELVAEFMSILQDVFRNIKGLVEETLSQDSPVLDPNVVMPSIRSFKVLAEMGMVVVTFSQSHRPMVVTLIQTTLGLNFEVLALESPAQRKAREDYEAMGSYWTGMAPTIKNPSAYADFVNAQIKMVSYVAYVIRGFGEQFDSFGERLILSALRLLQDLPANSIQARKDLMVVLRHLIGTPHRKALLPHIDKLFDEQILLGTGIGSRETIRPAAYASLADLVHHLRGELSAEQLAKVAKLYSTLLHNPYLGHNLHTLFSKMMFGLIENITAKATPQAAASILGAMFETCVDRVEAMTNILETTIECVENAKRGEESQTLPLLIERARPVAGAAYAVEKPEEVIQESRYLFRTLLHGFRVCLAGLKKCDGPIPDGTLIFRLFTSCIKCMVLIDAEPREATEIMDWFSAVLLEVNLHVFQEVWTHKIETFVQASVKRPTLLHICQTLFSREAVSPTLVAIVLRFLIDRLPQLGEYDDPTAVVSIRLFKMAFSAVTAFPGLNEPLLASHLAKLIMDCFPLAAKATKPTNYYHLLRGLFRAIGGGGGRFELLYKEVLPLLPEMLESLNRQLFASDGFSREMIVELCLTVPLRLTHLLPHLSYLMHPLALALRGSPELASQGLRTLELCIDNLTPDFLDPTLNTVLRELMEALHSHLKPLPANHHHAHTTIRVLGKLGGRNRRLLSKEPLLEHNAVARPASILLSFGGTSEPIELGPMSDFAARTLVKTTPPNPYCGYAYTFLETCINSLLHEHNYTEAQATIFVRCFEAILDAVHIPEYSEDAQKFTRELSKVIFAMEIRKNATKEAGLKRYPTPLLSSYLDAIPHVLARESLEEARRGQEIFTLVMQDLVVMIKEHAVNPQDVVPTLHQLANRFSALCLEDSWVHKSAGCNGIRILTGISDLRVKWVSDREVDFIRTLLHVLKDLPHDLHRDVGEVMDVLKQVLRVSNADVGPLGDAPVTSRPKLLHLIGILFAELSSPNPVVRQAVQACIELLVELTGKSAHELLLSHRDRMLTAIYTKPLRALSFPIQIGMIDAVRYCISLNPPLPELNDELLRLLHETLALADADDLNLGRGNPRQNALEIVKLRIACIKLLTASMPMTDFFSKQIPTRQRVTGVYFKSLYSPSQEVKEVAHEGLRMVLAHQSRLPKELLQTGLRPVLMNLADPKRLSVSGLEGLARLLELLINYFKVEIGHKLLDHFRIVADPQMLHASSRLPLPESEGITKLVQLANIFHLLPSAANIFLESLVNAIVQTEAQMHFSDRSPFSEPLGKYLDRYPGEALDLFLRHLHFPRHLRTLRSILRARLAPNLERELASRTQSLVELCLKSNNKSLLIPGLSLFDEIVDIQPNWTSENLHVVDVLIEIWRSERLELAQVDTMSSDVINRHALLLSIFKKTLQRTSRIDLLFEVVDVYTRNLAMDLTRLTQFLYDHVALNMDLLYRRDVLARFLIWFEDSSTSWATKTYFLRFIVTPTIIVQANNFSKDGLLDSEFVSAVHRTIWQPMIDDTTFASADDMFKIELLHLTTVLVHRFPELLEDVRRDIIRCAWHYITSDDAVVKQTAYLLAARFFEAFDTPQKFILRAWTGLLRPPHTEGKLLIKQALDILAPALPKSGANDVGYPQWAKTTRRLLAEEGNGFQQIIMIYQLLVRQPHLFYPVRALFIPHMVNSLTKLGLSGTASTESRILSVDISQVIFDWEQNSMDSDSQPITSRLPAWSTPLAFRETIVSFLVRLATAPLDPQSKNSLVSRALVLLRQMVAPTGWSDVTVKLNYFSRTLEQLELDSESHLNQALSTAKVLQVVTGDQDDAWYTANATVLQSLVRKGLMTDESELHDTLHPIFDRLLRLFPLPDRDEKQGEMMDFHNFVYTAIEDGLSNTSAIRGILLMLHSVVQISADRVQPFSASLLRLLSRLAKDHVNSGPNANGFDNVVRLITSIIDICKATVPYLGEHRKAFLGAFTALTEKSKSVSLCRYLLDVMREWVLGKNNTYPTMKDKLNILQKMAGFESRGEQLFHDYLDLVYDIYTEPSLRRSDLTSRLEQCFLLGCRAKDTSLRERFMDLLDASIPRSPPARLAYILGVQSWEPLADCNWIFLALHLLLGSVDAEAFLVPERTLPFDPLAGYLSARQKAASIVRPMQRLTFLDPHSAHDAWVSIFSAAWKTLSRKEQADMTLHTINLLSKDYHLKQAELRPNVIQTLLSGVRACNPPMTLPPHLVKYLAKTYGAWHVSLELLEQSVDHLRDDDSSIRDSVYDSLAEVYAELSEEDMFYGLWRRRCLHLETNVGIAFEQNGMWEQASHTYEIAQTKAKHGTIAFSETEYCLWEDHWMLAAEKLQQWDTLYELAKSEGNVELMLESAWRIKDWTEQRETLEDQINQLPDVATPRRRVFEAFIALLKLPGALDKNTEFTKILEDAMQLSLRKWVGLPPHLSVAHVPLLQHFQQFVELQEAVQIFGSLSTTNAQNLEKKSSDLKMVLQAWRERLPNLQDDISIWSDLVAWRQNVFNAINKAYIPLISNNNQAGNSSSTNFNTAGYRGYHETAWIINRFAHVARKHDLLDVCFSSLNKIYTLPNIEISEAFLKLREQARCHYQKPTDLTAGLEVINNTNLMYFSSPQKAEFFTLKGMFHARAGRYEDANHAFAQAVQMDMMQAKAWAEWGRYNDRMFKEHPTEMSHAANAVSCYLQAAGQYKNRKSRPLLTRVLWLLSVDDTNFTISRAFDTYKGEAAFWYWISLIPQLCLSINQREAKQARYILLNLAKLFPQALFFPLRTTKEDMVFVKKQAAAAAARAFNANHNVTVNGAKRGDGDQVMQDANGEFGSEITKRDASVADTSGSQQSSHASSQGDATSANPPASQMALHTPTEAQPTYAIRHAWEYVDEVVQILKTAFPLLILTMETMVDQILQRFKATSEEEIYRLICMLLQDAIQNYVVRTNVTEDDGQLASHTISNITKMATNLAGAMRKEYEDDFLKSKPTHYEYIRRLQRWRDRQEKHLDSRPRFQSLDLLSHYLTEFQYSKFDDIEVPGQYTEDKDSNQNFVHIQRFGPKFENCRSHGYCWKRFTVHGSDHSKTSFSVQLPSGRHCRREERVMQVFRMFNGALSRKKEARKRNLNFHIPAAVSCSPSLRLLQNDSSYVTLGDIYDRHCEEHGITREDPILVSGEKVKRVLLEFKQSMGRTPSKTEYFTLRKDIMDEVVAKLVPDDVLTKYMTRVMEGPSDLWRMRKQFASQVAATSFMTYVFCLTSRSPSRFHISRSTGLIAMSELLPGVASQAPVFASNDAVPFRLTPNMQRFLGPILTEGLLTTSILAIARCLTEPDFGLDQQLCLFARDEVMTWLHGRGQPWTFDLSFRTNVTTNIEGVVKRAEVMACKVERDHALANNSNPGSTPVVQTVTNLISTATNPMQLMRMTEIYHPWF